MSSNTKLLKTYIRKNKWGLNMCILTQFSHCFLSLCSVLEPVSEKRVRKRKRCDFEGCLKKAISNPKCIAHGVGGRCAEECPGKDRKVHRTRRRRPLSNMSRTLSLDSRCGDRKYDGSCATCFKRKLTDDPRSKVLYTRDKELAVRKAINKAFEGFVHEKPLYTSHCECAMRRQIDHRKLIYGSRDIDLLAGDIILPALDLHGLDYRVRAIPIEGNGTVAVIEKESALDLHGLIPPGQTIPIDAIEKRARDKDWTDYDHHHIPHCKLNLKGLEYVSVLSAQLIIVLILTLHFTMTIPFMQRFRATFLFSNKPQ